MRGADIGDPNSSAHFLLETSCPFRLPGDAIALIDRAEHSRPAEKQGRPGSRPPRLWPRAAWEPSGYIFLPGQIHSAPAAIAMLSVLDSQAGQFLPAQADHQQRQA